jgi:hypothetical protein
MVDNFKMSHFFLSVAQNAQYDDDTVFNENNVINYLGELEEYISLFITYMAYKKESPDPATASLSLEKMTVKEFEVREMKIEAPNTTELGMLQDDLETEDDVTTDPRLLYKRFEEVWSKENK